MGRRRPDAAGGDDMAGNRHMVSGMVVGGARGHRRGSVLLGVAQMSPTGTRTSAFVRTRGTTHPTMSQDGVIFPADTSRTVFQIRHRPLQGHDRSLLLSLKVMSRRAK